MTVAHLLGHRHQAGLVADRFKRRALRVFCDTKYSHTEAIEEINDDLADIQKDTTGTTWPYIKRSILTEFGCLRNGVLSAHTLRKYAYAKSPLPEMSSNVVVYNDVHVRKWNLAILDLPRYIRYKLQNPDNFKLMVRSYECMHGHIMCLPYAHSVYRTAVS
jgi:hypothetical protein